MRPPASLTASLRVATAQRLRTAPNYSVLHRPRCGNGHTAIKLIGRRFATSAITPGHVETITAGSQLPDSVSVKEAAADKPAPFTFPEGKHLIVGVPGAFTGTCHAQVPGYISQFEAFRAKGIEQIAVVAVNDVFVLKAWKENLAPGGLPDAERFKFISDDSGAFSAALGLLFDATPLLGNPRSKRYVIVANGKTVETIAVEEIPSELTVTKAETILAHLS